MAVLFFTNRRTLFQAQIATCTRDVAHVFCVPKAESSVVLMRTDDKTRGPGGYCSLVRLVIFIHANTLCFPSG